MTPCEACEKKLDPKTFEGKSLLEGLAIGARYGQDILDSHHVLLAARTKERDMERGNRDESEGNYQRTLKERDEARAALRESEALLPPEWRSKRARRILAKAEGKK